jgi:hypothetical protein
LHIDDTIKAGARAVIEHAGRGSGGVCSKAARSVFIPGKEASGIAACDAGKRRGNGRGGKRSNGIGKL